MDNATPNQSEIKVSSAAHPNEFSVVAHRLHWLQKEVAVANTYFHLATHLTDAFRGPQYGQMVKSLDFWGYTLRAHWQLAFLYLCRVYDDHAYGGKYPDSEPIHLLRFVKQIDRAKLSQRDQDQHLVDMKFLQKANGNDLPDPKVVKLRKIRHNLLAHNNIKLVQGGLDEFLKGNQFTREEIQDLIDKAFSILQRWANHYSESAPTSLRKLATGSDDYQFVLDSLQRL